MDRFQVNPPTTNYLIAHTHNALYCVWAYLNARLYTPGETVLVRVRDIAAELGYGVRSIQKALTDLKNRGNIEVSEKFPCLIIKLVSFLSTKANTRTDKYNK